MYLLHLLVLPAYIVYMYNQLTRNGKTGWLHSGTCIHYDDSFPLDTILGHQKRIIMF